MEGLNKEQCEILQSKIHASAVRLEVYTDLLITLTTKIRNEKAELETTKWEIQQILDKQQIKSQAK